MRVIKRKTLEDFWKSHKDCEEQLKAWFYEARHAKWNSFSDIKRKFSSADVIPGDRVVFNIKGNKYRLIVKIKYSLSIVYIRFIGTHAEYDKVDAEEI